jgi:hypothetical protein
MVVSLTRDANKQGTGETLMWGKGLIHACTFGTSRQVFKITA